jgi:hypothetical protein
VSSQRQQLSQERLSFIAWVRTETPCGAQFLLNQRPEGTMTALTGRFELSEGMGPFLRVDRLPYVTMGRQLSSIGWRGALAPPAAQLLRGPCLHCLTTPAHF